MTELLPWMLTGAFYIATLRHVYRGGTTLNDHLVGVFVGGCLVIYPLLWVGGQHAGYASLSLAIVLFSAVVSIYGLFFVMDRRRDAGWLMPLAILSQPAYAFALWAWPVLLLWLPYAWWFEQPLLWPGTWLFLPLGLAVWGSCWTYFKRDHLRFYRLGERRIRIVQLSDIHVSPTMRARDMQRLVAQVNRLQPDVVAVTGDLVMPFSEEEHGFLITGLASIEAPTFCCMGNHDLPIADTLKQELTEVGVAMLVDEQQFITVKDTKVAICGLDFHWREASQKSLAALSNIPDEGADYRLLLVHDPRYYRWLPKKRYDLLLCGHTHGGQVGANMFGVAFSALRLLGLYDQGFFGDKNSKMYVHKGNWHTGLPPRMGIASEIAVFDI